jgi:hypothetical protein
MQQLLQDLRRFLRIPGPRVPKADWQRPQLHAENELKVLNVRGVHGERSLARGAMSQELLDARVDEGAYDEDEEYDTRGGDGDSSKFARFGETVAILMLHIHICCMITFSSLHGDLLNLHPASRLIWLPGLFQKSPFCDASESHLHFFASSHLYTPNDAYRYIPTFYTRND